MYQELEKHKQACYLENIKPLQESDRAILNSLKKIESKLDIVMPTIKEINDIKKAWNLAGIFGSTVVKIVVSVGIILGGLYSLKEWFRK